MVRSLRNTKLSERTMGTYLPSVHSANRDYVILVLEPKIVARRQ